MRTRPTHHIRARNGAAFTLVEVIVATILVGIISASIALVISRSVRTRSVAEARAEASQRAQSAAQSIARDLSMLVRDSDAQGSLLRLIPGPAGPDARGDLLMLSRSERAVRVQGEENEGPVHEVQYRIRTEADAPALWRREDPFPDEYIDAGGVAGPVVPGVVALKAEAFDGQAWSQDWDSDVQGLPLAVRITITASADRLDSAGAQVVRWARAVVAIDRTPMPTGLAAAPQPIQQQQNQQNPTTPGTGTGTTTTTTRPGAGGGQPNGQPGGPPRPGDGRGPGQGPGEGPGRGPGQGPGQGPGERPPGGRPPGGGGGGGGGGGRP